MALTPIEQIRVLVGDTESSPFYPQLSDDQIQGLLDLSNNNIFAAARLAAISISMAIAGYSKEERTGDITVINDYARNYLRALDYLINSPISLIPSGLIPWAGGISKSEVCANDRNPDTVQSPLNNIYTCDADDPCNTICGC